jgi:hypothetical protein
MRRALRDNHFQRRPHMGCAEVPGHGAAIASAKNDMDMERGLAFEPDRPSYGIRLSDKTSGLRTRETMSKGSQLHECGLSATSPISEATSTCSCTGILSYVFVSQLKHSKVASLDAPIAVNAAAWMCSRSTKSCRLERTSSPVPSTTTNVRCPSTS